MSRMYIYYAANADQNVCGDLDCERSGLTSLGASACAFYGKKKEYANGTKVSFPMRRCAVATKENKWT